MTNRPRTCRHCGAELEQPMTGRPPRFCSARCRYRWHHKEVRTEGRRKAREAREKARAALEREQRRLEVPEGIDPARGWPDRRRPGMRPRGPTRPRFQKPTVPAREIPPRR